MKHLKRFIRGILCTSVLVLILGLSMMPIYLLTGNYIDHVSFFFMYSPFILGIVYILGHEDF